MEINLSDGERIEELFLNGVKIIQNENLYRFTSDAVLLTRFARAKKNEILADFCSGSGIVGLHFYALHPDKGGPSVRNTTGSCRDERAVD